MSSRNLDSVTEAGYNSDIFAEVILCQLNTTDINNPDVLDPIRVTNHTANIEWNGNLYYGFGNLLNIGEVEESTELAARSIEVTFAAFPLDTLNIVINAKYQNRDAWIYRGIIDLESNILYGDPFLLMRGKLDTSKIAITEEQLVITTTIRSILSDWSIPKAIRMNSATHKKKYFDDNGLEYVELISEMDNVKWKPLDPPKQEN